MDGREVKIVEVQNYLEKVPCKSFVNYRNAIHIQKQYRLLIPRVVLGIKGMCYRFRQLKLFVP